MNKGVLTEYRVNGNLYGSYIVGDNLKDKIKQRNLGEEVVGLAKEINVIPDYSKESSAVIIKDYSKVLHTACFLSYAAIKSGKLSVDDILGDEGILHELIHINEVENKSSEVNKIRSLLLKLKENTIGLFTNNYDDL